MRAKTDFTLNHLLAQGSIGGVVDRLERFDLQEDPQAVGQRQQQLAGAHRFRLWCLCASFVAQLRTDPFLAPGLIQ